MTEPYTAIAGAGGKDRSGRERMARYSVGVAAPGAEYVRRCSGPTSHSGFSLARPPGSLPLGQRCALAIMPDGGFRSRVRSPRS